MFARLLLTLACRLLMTGTALARLNINTASPEQLDGRQGIGPSGRTGSASETGAPTRLLIQSA